MTSNPEKIRARGQSRLSETLIPPLILTYLLGPLFLLLSVFFSVRDLLLDPVGYESVEAGDEEVEKILTAIH